MDIIEHRFTDLSQLQYRILTCEIGGPRPARVMILSFHGQYGHGSRGNGDGTFMRMITQAALSVWLVDGIVFDLRDLAYEWGDRIWQTYDRGIEKSGINDRPYVTIMSDKCRNGLLSCESIVGPLFDDLDSGLANLGPRVQAYLDKFWADEEQDTPL